MKKKSRKVIGVILAALILLVVAMLILLKTGAFVKIGASEMAQRTEVPRFDLLAWQAQREQDILTDYNNGNYTMQNPYLIVDPYEFNPLSALVIFDHQSEGDITVKIAGRDTFSSIEYVKPGNSGRYEIPVIGLYAGTKNTVTLSDASGETVTLYIETEPLPIDFQQYTLITSKPDQMEPGITLFTACFEHSYSAIVDCYGEVRGYISNMYMGHGTSMNVLENGRMLATGDLSRFVPYNMKTIWEFNWLGKIFVEYQVVNGVHHDLSELENGDFIATSNHYDMFVTGTREDVIIVIDRETGLVTREYDFRNILDETRQMYNHFDPDIEHVANIDWMHANAALCYEPNNSIIVSSPIQSFIVSINADTEEIQWILGPHENYNGSSAYLKEYLLTPVGDDFEWQWGQHQPQILPDFDNNPDTIDMMIFDNGQSRSAFEETSIAPADNYSRAVHFRINTKEMTVEQIWQYGKERGAECYAAFLGDANYMEQTGNRLITFGGQIRVDGAPSDFILSGVRGESVVVSRVVEVNENKDVVYEISVEPTNGDVSGETYQAKRMNLYDDGGYAYRLGEVVAPRIGAFIPDFIDADQYAPVLYANKIGVDFDQIFVQGNRLLMDGYIGYPDAPARIGGALIVLRSNTNSFLFRSRFGLAGRFFADIDLSSLPAGEYAISVAGKVSNGNDALGGDFTTGHIKTDYKVTVGN